MASKVSKIAGLALSLSITTAPALADISIGNQKSNRLGKAESLAPNWSTLHSNPIDNSYQETIRIMEVCINGRSFAVSQSMAGVWSTGTGAGAGAGAGIVQIFDADGNGVMRAVTCK